MQKKKFSRNQKYIKGRNSKSGKDEERAESPSKSNSTTVRSYNDPSWYIRKDQLASDVASLSFNNALGARLNLDVDNQGSFSAASRAYSAPGIITLNYVPAPGASTGPYSPINVAAKNLYSWVRHQNSGSKNYDSPDLMLYVLSMDSIISAILHLQRAYGTARMYSQLNRYVGDALLTSMGFNPEDVRSNLAQFRANINMLLLKASCFAVPASMSLFRRHAWMNRMVFKESDLEKSGFYLYRPVGFWSYEETSGGPGYLHLNPCAVEVKTYAGSRASDEYINCVQWTTSQWVTYVNGLLQKLVASEDIGIMSGDIIKAYGQENLFHLDFVDEGYFMELAYSEEILDQIHNTNFASAAVRTVTDISSDTQLHKVDWSSFDVAQDPSIGDGALYFAPQCAHVRHLAYEHLLDMYDAHPSPERVMVASRNQLFANVNTVGQFFTIGAINCCGSDICLFADIYKMYQTPDNNWALTSTNYYREDGSLVQVCYDLESLFAFHRAPIAYCMGSAANNTGLTTIYGEIDNYNNIDNALAHRLHESAILSMLGVPV